jgi:hypothetical protein
MYKIGSLQIKSKESFILNLVYNFNVRESLRVSLSVKNEIKNNSCNYTIEYCSLFYEPKQTVSSS